MRHEPRRKRSIELRGGPRRSSLRVAILLCDADDRRLDYIVDLQHELGQAGHTAGLAPRTRAECGMSVERIARMMKKTAADAWVVLAGPQAVLEWFKEEMRRWAS
ncbi:MAG: hypothetical protein NTW21_28515 [Verrucomicrobia bacterium]|nr:hypothetical protein [Verrucomicrobiota bacterium]